MDRGKYEKGGGGEQQSKNKVESKCRIKTKQQSGFQIKINPRVRIRINCHQTNQISVQYAEFSGLCARIQKIRINCHQMNQISVQYAEFSELFLCQNPRIKINCHQTNQISVQYAEFYELFLCQNPKVRSKSTAIKRTKKKKGLNKLRTCSACPRQSDLVSWLYFFPFMCSFHQTSFCN